MQQLPFLVFSTGAHFINTFDGHLPYWIVLVMTNCVVCFEFQDVLVRCDRCFSGWVCDECCNRLRVNRCPICRHTPFLTLSEGNDDVKSVGSMSTDVDDPVLHEAFTLVANQMVQDGRARQQLRRIDVALRQFLLSRNAVFGMQDRLRHVNTMFSREMYTDELRGMYMRFGVAMLTIDPSVFSGAALSYWRFIISSIHYMANFDDTIGEDDREMWPWFGRDDRLFNNFHTGWMNILRHCKEFYEMLTGVLDEYEDLE